MDIDAWDLRHLLLSLDDRPRGHRDDDDLAGVVRRAAESSLVGLLAHLPADTVVLPGHGGVTTVARDRPAHETLPPVAA